jgi:hypothetical protein
LIRGDLLGPEQKGHRLETWARDIRLLKKKNI